VVSKQGYAVKKELKEVGKDPKMYPEIRENVVEYERPT
jgi:hypothetical protein